MHKAFVAALVVSSSLLLAAPAGLAGSGPRLNGSFQMTGTVGNNDVGVPPGSEISDVYTFKSSCSGSGGCAKVTLIRKSGTRNLKTTLTRKAPGVYKGKEGPAPYVCVSPIGAKAEFTGEHKITVTKARKGKATKISARLVDHITGCDETFEEATFRGRLTK